MAVLPVGCVRLSRIEFNSCQGHETASATTGLRVRPTQWLDLDLTTGTAFDVESGVATQHDTQFGATLHQGGWTLRGRMEFVPPGRVTSTIGAELEW